MSGEKFPTLCSVLLAFSAIQRCQKELQEFSQYSLIIQPDIDKLDNYIEKINAVPAYIVTMSKLDFVYIYIYLFFIFGFKLQVRVIPENDDSNDAEWAKSIFIHEVSQFSFILFYFVLFYSILFYFILFI